MQCKQQADVSHERGEQIHRGKKRIDPNLREVNSHPQNLPRRGNSNVESFTRKTWVEAFESDDDALTKKYSQEIDEAVLNATEVAHSLRHLRDIGSAAIGEQQDWCTLATILDRMFLFLSIFLIIIYSLFTFLTIPY